MSDSSCPLAYINPSALNHKLTLPTFILWKLNCQVYLQVVNNLPECLIIWHNLFLKVLPQIYIDILLHWLIMT